MKNKARLLSLALALLLLLSAVPFAALADEEVEPAAVHTHSYTTGFSSGYAAYSNAKHSVLTYKVYTCSCGYSERELIENATYQELHTAKLGSKKFLITYLGDSGETITVYQFTCSVCGNTYEDKEISMPATSVPGNAE